MSDAFKLDLCAAVAAADVLHDAAAAAAAAAERISA
jgi:hypothetical protein